jgi:Protein of unknown function (DUF3768)
MSEQLPQPNEIARLNDEFRRNGPNENWLATLCALALSNFPGLVQAVRDFDAFTPDNDPWGEHDFGSIAWHTETTYWKIDYYDQVLQYWHDPLSPECRRVLTVLLASEY